MTELHFGEDPPAPTPTLSVIIPLYQAEATIDRAIDSVLAQTLRPLEIIVVDDGSTDAGPDRVRARADPRIVLIAQANAGCGAARNAGLAAARGDFVAFLDADDEWLPRFLERAVHALERFPGVLVYQGASVELGLDTGTPSPAASQGEPDVDDRAPQTRLESPPSGDAKALKRRIDHSLCTMLARRDLLLELGGYYDRDGCRYGEDSVLSLLIHWNHAVLRDETPVHLRHQLESGLSRRNRRHPVVRPLVDDAEYAMARIAPADRPAARRLIAYLSVLDASRLAGRGHVRPAWSVLRRTLAPADLVRPDLALPLVRCALRAGLGSMRRASRRAARAAPSGHRR